jgi:penicillin-binding protein 1A
LTYSVNTATVRLAEKVGVNAIIQMAEKLGLPKPSRDLSIALGTMQTSLLRLVNAFTIIGNQGIAVKPYGILEIRNGRGKVLYRREPLVVKEVIDPLLLQQLLPVLQAVVDYGTGKAAKIPGKEVKGKTGTTQKFRDAWFIGLVDHMAAGVWMGNPDDTPMNHVSGGTLPTQLWRKIMEQVLPPSVLPMETASLLGEK